MIRFRKIFSYGPFKTSLSKTGVGFSWGLPGLRFGVSPNGKKYVSIGIPGSGLYMIKYFDANQKISKTQQSLLNQTPNITKDTEPWWKQKNLNN